MKHAFWLVLCAQFVRTTWVGLFGIAHSVRSTVRPIPGAADLGANWPGGFFCPCHGSKFDLAGRVFKNVPAPTNLEVPAHHFASGNRLLIGVDPVG